MNLTGLAAIIEALLFAAGKPLEVSELEEITEQTEINILEALKLLKERLEAEDSGICLLKLENAYQLTTKPQHYDYLVKMAAPSQKSMLSGAALETLSIVAYNQPVTRSSVEFIRGVNSDSAINRLIERGLIEECGRLDTPGKPLIYRTTPEFLKTFGISSLDELPDISNIPIQLTFYDV
ncbi:MAG: SMC-Scp complex subunit ScpB [Monoglobales bacterium]